MSLERPLDRALKPRCAKKKARGVLPDLESPIRIRSASGQSSGCRPSSNFRVNSIASQLEP